MSTIREITVDALNPGDCFTFDRESRVYRVVSATMRHPAGPVELDLRDEMERQVVDARPADEVVTVGYTNRRAKRQRIKAARRERMRGESGA